MLALGPLAFTQPWLLGALALLPVIWWLLRATPPSPRRVIFAPLFILRKLVSPERTPARTPLWLLLLRLLIATLLILAMAGPVLYPRAELVPGRDLLIVLDDGWAAGPGWERRLQTLQALLDQAERQLLPVHLLRTAPGRDGISLKHADASTLRREVADWLPSPWPVDREAAMAALAELAPDSAQVVWLSDGIITQPDEERTVARFAAFLRRLGPLVLHVDEPEGRAPLLREPVEDGEGLAVEFVRPAAGGDLTVEVLARGPSGEVLARLPVSVPHGSRTGGASLRLPAELRNRIAQLEVEGSSGAGTIVLFDERWRRRVVGLAGSLDEAEGQPLLSELYFIRRALEPYAGIVEDRIERLVEQPVSLIVLADVGRLSTLESERLQAWIERGGVVLRFAGPKLAAGGDPLLPVELRQGDRVLGGALSWSEPARIAPFPPGSPFAGIEPDPEVLVYRQVLAEPGPELADRTLAALEDGTPIVTGRRLGEGWLLLVHTTANTSWSTLPLSRLFIDMLRRVITLAPGVGGSPEGLLDADRVLDGLGRLVAPPPDLLPVPAAELAEARPGPKTPPGLWLPLGSADAAGGEAAAVALNLQDAVSDTLAFGTTGLGASVRGYAAARETELGRWLLLAAFVLALADLIVAFALRGLLRFGAATAALLLALPVLTPAPADGQEDAGDLYVELAAETRLAYVRTGIPEVDRLSEAGLMGLGFVLAQRTSVEPAEPVAVDVAEDELALFPLLYWPIPPDHPDLAEEALERVDDYLQQGGMILFDTGDAARLLPGQSGGGPGEQRLAELLQGLDLPPLVPVPPDHALTRAFYLLQEFPGRFTGQPVWVDEAPPGINDGVSRVVIGAHDWAGAWAVDEYGSPLLPVVPGGERQREMARRFGVNLVMYALTGNYKTDQVHVPALLERLGQ